MDKLYQNSIHMKTKKHHPLKILTGALLFYWIITFITMFYLESKHPGGEQFLLRIFAIGMNYFPFWGITVSISLIFYHKEWAVKRWYILLIIILLFIYLFVFSWWYIIFHPL